MVEEPAHRVAPVGDIEFESAVVVDVDQCQTTTLPDAVLVGRVVVGGDILDEVVESEGLSSIPKRCRADDRGWRRRWRNGLRGLWRRRTATAAASATSKETG